MSKIPEEYQLPFSIVAQAIRTAESSSDQTKAYDIVFAFAQNKDWFKQAMAKYDGATAITELSVNKLAALQRAMIEQGLRSTAMGAFQIISGTLSGLNSTLKLTGNEKFDRALQVNLNVFFTDRFFSKIH